MRIVVQQAAMTKIEAGCTVAGRLEVSGFGFVQIEDSDFVIYDAEILAAGDGGFTIIPPARIMPLLMRDDAHKMKLWWHKHPVGNGKPGQHNWSGTDSHTARKEPLGGSPETAKWSVSMVKTPGGWVGRYDTYGPDGKTWHLPVVVEGVDMNAVKELWKVLAVEYRENWKKHAQERQVSVPQYYGDIAPSGQNYPTQTVTYPKVYRRMNPASETVRGPYAYFDGSLTSGATLCRFCESEPDDCICVCPDCGNSGSQCECEHEMCMSCGGYGPGCICDAENGHAYMCPASDDSTEVCNCGYEEPCALCGEGLDVCDCGPTHTQDEMFRRGWYEKR